VKQDEAHAMLVMPDGKLFVAGSAFTWDGPSSKTGAPFFLRLTDAGVPDTTFGPGGVLAASGRILVSSLALTPTGDVVTIGYAVGTSFAISMGVARYRPNGVLDLSFGNAGVVAFALAQTGSNASVGVVEPDGRIVVAGYGTEPSEFRNQPYFIDYYFGLARLEGDGAACGLLYNPGIDRQAIEQSYERFRMKFKWRGPTPLGFDPTTSDDVGLCLYSSWGRVLKSVAPAGGTCGSRPCWSGTPSRHFGYRDADRSPNGIEKVRLSAGRARIDGSGFNLTRNLHSFPNPSVLTGTAPLLVQVHGGNGACFQAALTDLEEIRKPFGQGSYIQIGVRGTGQ
jgi:uncharacterized delta-60 repeat protein